MKTPTFTEGVAVALAAATLGSMGYSVLHDLLGLAWSTRALITGLGLAYTLYLLSRSREVVGRAVTLATWLTLGGLSWLLIDDTLLFLGVHLGMIWLVRSLYHQPGPLAALLDLTLNLAALAAGAWALTQAGSPFLGIWTFFLVQALFVTIPGRRSRDTDAGDAPQPDRFLSAYRSAEAALRKLSTQQ